MIRTTARLLILLAAMPCIGAAQELSVTEFIDASGVREGTRAARELAGWDAGPTIVVREIPGMTDALAGELPDAKIIVVSNEEDAMAHAAQADAILGFCSPALMAAAEQLIWVQAYWAGVERCLAVDKIGSGQVLLTNMQKMSSPTIGEHAIAMMLSLTRGLAQFARAMPDGGWRRDLAGTSGMQSVDGSTMLVVGLGGIGKQVAQRAKGLGMRVIATRNSSREGPPYVDYVGLSDELEELASQADVIVNALPLTGATEALFDRDFFAGVKAGVVFINVGRGKTVVTADLLAALQSGRVAGAGLDVTEPEPLPAEHPLWQLPNVIITPHVAGFGGSRRWHAMLVEQNIRRFVAGDVLLNEVDPARGY